MTEWSHQTWLRLKSLIWRQQLNRDLEDELQFHLAMREQKRQAQGLEPAEARTQTRRAFGNVGLLEEACRDLWTFSWPETILQDLRYGVRMLPEAPQLKRENARFVTN